jgi:hypothetical protein
VKGEERQGRPQQMCCFTCCLLPDLLLCLCSQWMASTCSNFRSQRLGTFKAQRRMPSSSSMLMMEQLARMRMRCAQSLSSFQMKTRTSQVRHSNGVLVPVALYASSHDRIETAAWKGFNELKT